MKRGGLTLLESMLAFVIFSIALIPILQVHHSARGDVKDAAVLCRLLINTDAGSGRVLRAQWPLWSESLQAADSSCRLVVERPVMDPSALIAPMIEEGK